MMNGNKHWQTRIAPASVMHRMDADICESIAQSFMVCLSMHLEGRTSKPIPQDALHALVTREIDHFYDSCLSEGKSGRNQPAFAKSTEAFENLRQWIWETTGIGEEFDDTLITMLDQHFMRPIKEVVDDIITADKETVNQR